MSDVVQTAPDQIRQLLVLDFRCLGVKTDFSNNNKKPSLPSSVASSNHILENTVISKRSSDWLLSA